MFDINADTNDSRELIEYIDELEEEITDYDELRDDEPDEMEDEREELEALKGFAEEIEGYNSDFHHGCTLINSDHWKEYVQELAEETAGGDYSEWPLNCIDWSDAATELEHDYAEIECLGESFFVCCT